MTPRQAKNRIKKHGLELTSGVYNFFKCGHISRHVPGSQNYKTVNSKCFLCCPDCKNPNHEKSSYLIKFKLCECGEESTGKSLKDGRCCDCKKNNPVIKSAKVLTEESERASLDRFDCKDRSPCLARFLVKHPYAKFLSWCFGCDNYAGAGL